MHLPELFKIRMARFSAFPILLVVIMAQFFLYSCNQPGKKQEFVEAGFNVDPTLLASESLNDSELGFTMKYPADWKMLGDEYTSQLGEQILIGKYAPARIVNGLVDPVDSSMLIILDVSKVDSSFFSDLKENYEVIFNQGNAWLNVQLETFTHQCFVIDQYVLQNERLVQFRLQCREKEQTTQQPQFEIYFFMNRMTLNDNIKSIESSIGTLNCLN